MQRGVGDDLSVRDGQQGEIAAQIDVLTPVADHVRLGDAVFNEHAFRRRDIEEELVEFFLIVLPQRPQRAWGFVFERDLLWELLEFEVE